jgi:corrinoid protein of di/trimethylamine methyltransferase
MGNETMHEQLKQSIVDQDPDAVLEAVNKALADGMDPREVIDKGLLPGLNVIGEQFECEDIFLPELMQAALAFQSAMTVLEPKIKEAGGADEKKGTIVIGTVKGDLHSIGKNILKLLFETSGFEVHDLGIDVDLFKFIDKASETNADIIAISALLTTTLIGQRDVIDALKDQGTRDKYKVIVGGGATTKEWADTIGADGWSGSAYDAVVLATKLVS